MNSPYDRGHQQGASKAKNNATKGVRKAFKIKKAELEGTTPNARFESAVSLARAKYKELKKVLKALPK